MSFNIYLWLLMVVTLCIAQDEDDITQFNICEFPLNINTWFAADMNGVLFSFGTADQPEILDIGYQDFLIQNVQGVLDSSYTCGAFERCDLRPLNENCNDNPTVATILKAMVNWNHFWQIMSETVVDATNSLSSQVDTFTEVFQPPDRSPLQAADQLPLSFIVLQVLYTLLLEFLPIKNGQNEFQPPRDFSVVIDRLLSAGVTTANNPGTDAGFDGFEDIIASSNAVQRAVTETLQQYIEDRLNDKGVFLDENINDNMPFYLQSGDFADPLGIQDQEIFDQLNPVLSAPVINRMWNTQQVVIVKAGPEFFSPIDFRDGPCDGGDEIPTSHVFCDEDRNAYIFRKVPLDPAAVHEEDIFNLEDPEPYNVPGIENLSDFGLDGGVMIVTAEANQDQTGYFGALLDDEFFRERLVGRSISAASLSDRIFSNLPVCDVSRVELAPEQIEICSGTLLDAPTLCLVQTVLLCGCPEQSIDDIDWPYQTSNAPQCGDFFDT